MNPLVSVVIPVYNVEKYLERCIQSVVDQTYPELEIILVDDGSPDNCPEICDLWAKKDSRIKTIHQENSGAGLARNTGIENAGGEYILFVDSDDYLADTAIDEIVRNIQENNSDAVIFAHTIFYDNKDELKVKLKNTKAVFDNESVKNNLLPGLFTYDMNMSINVWTKMFRLDVILKNNLRFLSERECYSEDALFVLEYFSKISRVSILNKNIYFHYDNKNSLSKTYNEDREKKLDYFLQLALEIADRENLPEKVKTHICARYHFYAIFKFKQIVLLKKSYKQRKRMLRLQYKNELFRSTLSKDVLNLEKKSLRIFYTLVKYKLYFLSDLLLLYRVRK